jgi:hypothetical protein
MFICELRRLDKQPVPIAVGRLSAAGKKHDTEVHNPRFPSPVFASLRSVLL